RRRPRAAPACAGRSRLRPRRAGGSNPRLPRARPRGSRALRPPLRSGRAACAVRLLLRDEGDLAARLEDRPGDLGERGGLLAPGRLGDLFDREALTAQVALQHLAVLHEDDRVAVQHASGPAEPVREPRGGNLEDGDRPDGDGRPGYGVVVLRQALLDGVAEDDQQDQVERLERGELPPPDHPRQQVDEPEERDSPDGDVHYGKTLRLRENVISRVVPSLSQTVCSRFHATVVGSTWKPMKRM